MTAILLYLTDREISEIEPLVSLLITRVSKSDKDYWKNLKKGLAWVNNTIEDKRIIVSINLSKIFVWIDVSYAMHHNMRSHTGGYISMGYGIIHG